MNSNLDSTARPLLSFVLLAYNQEKFIHDAVIGAFNQTYSPLEIVLSDDCSADDTFAIMKNLVDAYCGPHKVVLNRNPQNLGIGAHVNAVMAMACGQWVVSAAGDDISYPERAMETYRGSLANPDARSIYFSFDTVREPGLPPFRWEPREERHTAEGMIPFAGPKIIGAAHSWHRAIFDIFGRIPDSNVAEDKVIPFRSALTGSVVFIDRPMIAYRVHGGSVSQVLSRSDPDPAVRLGRQVRVARERVQALRSFERDLATAAALGIVDRDRADRLKAAIESALHKHELVLLWLSGSYAERVRAISKLLVTNVETWPMSRLNKAWAWSRTVVPWLTRLRRPAPSSR